MMTVETRHVIEVATTPHSAAEPRRYYAADYPLGSVVVDRGISWAVVSIDNTVLFQAGAAK